MKLWRELNPEQAREIGRRSYYANRDKILERGRRYYRANLEQRREASLRRYDPDYYRQWRLENLERQKAHMIRLEAEARAALVVFNELIGRCLYKDRFTAKRVLQQLVGENQ